MKNLFVKIYLIILVCLAQFSMAKIYPDGVSSGTLVINNEQKIPVKIFSSTWGPTFANFPDKKLNDSRLVIVNDEIKESLSLEQKRYGKAFTLNNYFTHGYVSLSKDFQPISKFEDLKYLYKPISEKAQINPGDHVELKTQFIIWDPSKGLQIGSFTLHYYSLMFVIAFGLGYFLMKKMFEIDGVDLKYLEPLFTWTLIGTILGARLGHVIFYQPELFKEDFWSVFLPIQTNPTFKFTGFSGLASHGAALALILTTLYYSYKIIKKNPFWVYDRLGIVVAIGGAFVRIGNFLNSEIIGKEISSSSPFAVLFPQQSRDYGLTVPRYPSQLFEAAGYVLLFILLWYLYRKTDKKKQQGWLFGLFFILLWSIRFFVEFLKEPQGDEMISFAGLDTGQILSIPFIIAGILIMIYSKKNREKA